MWYWGLHVHSGLQSWGGGVGSWVGMGHLQAFPNCLPELYKTLDMRARPVSQDEIPFYVPGHREPEQSPSSHMAQGWVQILTPLCSFSSQSMFLLDVCVLNSGVHEKKAVPWTLSANTHPRACGAGAIAHSLLMPVLQVCGVPRLSEDSLG